MIPIKKIMTRMLASVLLLNLLLTGCSAADTEQHTEQHTNQPETQAQTPGSEGGLVAEQVLDGAEGEIHYSYFLPQPYDASRTYPLVMTMPGYDMMWFGESSSGSNLHWNGFLKWTELDEEMIVVSAQLTDWGEKSARQAVELTEYFLSSFSVDPSRVYAAGYSAGGETMSRAVSMRPDLFAAYLHGASQWDGTYSPLAEHQVAVYIFMGENDEYYGSQKARDAYNGLLTAYREAGLTDAEIDTLLHLNIPDNAWFNSQGIYNYHGGGNVVFNDQEILEWIIQHRKEAQPSAAGFSDVPAGAWYADAVSYAVERGLMDGTGNGAFSPEAPASRAMLAAILHRASGGPAPGADAGFPDVPADAYYAGAAGWALERGIMTGYGDGRFGGSDPITREQMAAILWRYAGSPDSSSAQSFADEGDISAFARDAVNWARNGGIMSGKNGNRFDPRGTATRAELAMVLFNYFTAEGDTMENKRLNRPVLGDMPEEYQYGGWSYALAAKKLPLPVGNQTVLNTEADPAQIQVLYLWEEGNVPAVTRFTPNMTGYFDDWDFRPYVTAIPVREGVTPKGAVVLMAGGAYQFRGNYTDSLPTADALRELGFVTFIVDYRLRPYSQEEGALDVARAVRFVRKNAGVYGFAPDNIAVMGFSAGGIQAGEFLMHYDEDVNGTVLDPDYVPDELDQIPAHASAGGMIYAFYGRLSVGSMNPDWLREGDLPPTFYAYGTEDPFYRQFEQQYAVLEGMGHPVQRIVLQNWPHGFGAAGGWVEEYAAWLEDVWNSV